MKAHPKKNKPYPTSHILALHTTHSLSFCFTRCHRPHYRQRVVAGDSHHRRRPLSPPSLLARLSVSLSAVHNPLSLPDSRPTAAAEIRRACHRRQRLISHSHKRITVDKPPLTYSLSLSRLTLSHTKDTLFSLFSILSSPPLPSPTDNYYRWHHERHVVPWPRPPSFSLSALVFSSRSGEPPQLVIILTPSPPQLVCQNSTTLPPLAFLLPTEPRAITRTVYNRRRRTPNHCSRSFFPLLLSFFFVYYYTCNW